MAMNENITILPNKRDEAEWFVYWGKGRARIGTIRIRFTPQLTYDAWRGGTLIYSPADTLERAAQALADYSTNPVKS